MNTRFVPLLAGVCGVAGAAVWAGSRTPAPTQSVPSASSSAAKALPAPISNDKLARATGAEVPFRPSGEANVEVRFVPRAPVAPGAASEVASAASRTPRRKGTRERRSAPIVQLRNRPKIVYNPAGGAVAILDKSWRTSVTVRTGKDGKLVMGCRDGSHLNADGSHNDALHKKAAAARRP